MRLGLLFAVIVVAAGCATTSHNHSSPMLLKVSENRRFLVREDGSPFFYLGDTAWELFHRLTREEAELYLRDRAARRFTVIQAVVLAELDGLNTPNAYGEKPLCDQDPTRPNEKYFEHVDWIVNCAASLGLVIGMLPTWGDKVNPKWAKNSKVIFTPQNAMVFGEFLGKRYKDKPIIWILGGDRPIESNEHLSVWRAMAAGLRRGDGGRHLISYHPQGGHHSSQWLHNEPWLDFNMIQSGHHQRDGANYEMIARDYALTPPKPCMDAEPRYENHPCNWKPDELGWFDEFDVRKAAYWSVFAGGHGVTYGCHDIWQFYEPPRPPIGHARTPWKESLHQPGSAQMQHLRRLIESRPFLLRVPDQSLLAADAGRGGEHVRATRGSDGSYAFVYVPSGKPVRIQMDKLAGKVRALWFDPRTGTSTAIGEFPNRGVCEFIPPAHGPDWVLILDEARRDFPIP